ncbi:prolyl-tRNA synthetase [Halocaridina rubra]|uniref:Probable proline--tRNA ligase, mitochondrial n=1 Tax=Halocaridina rubra TaxID=373956 RepID=A0AAN8ZYC9_HALRR
MKMYKKSNTLKHTRCLHYLLRQFYHQYRVSQLYQPLSVVPKEALVKKDAAISLSQKLMMECGILRPRGNGMFAFLPLGLRALEKLSAVIDEEMKRVGAQKILLPSLTSGLLWKKTGRWESTGEELMKVKDRHERDYVLSATHEEAIVDMLADTSLLSHRQLSLRLYQISSKFRDEANPRFGLLRCKEFLMKDLYTFDKDETSATDTYNQICTAYDTIFQRIGIPFVKVSGDCGNIGGNFSHEYHFPAPIGQDTLLLCENCGTGSNAELVEDLDNKSCNICGSKLQLQKGIEVGHTFLLGIKYSEPLQCYYQNEKGKPTVVQMGCYGIGISRVLAAAIEVLSTEKNIRWPWLLAPFKVCIVGPKKGSKEEKAATWVNFLARSLNNFPSLRDDIIVDDRDNLTIGKRVMEAKKTGFPIIVVLGKYACEPIPQFEVIETAREEVHYFTQYQLLDYLKNR